MNARRVQSPGFSLIELSIVIVIIGLIMGGIMTGRSLIKNAELMSIGNDVERYRQSVAGFQQQFTELPGDFTRAAAIWGTGTVSGNGNGIVNGSGEDLRFWQHLALAKMIDGQFTGLSGMPASYIQAGVNVPATRYKNGAVSFQYLGTQNAHSWYFNDTYGHIYYLSNGTGDRLVTAEDAKNLDRKFDDGLVASGTIKPFRHNISQNMLCATSDESDYDVKNEAVRCQLLFKSGV